MDSLEDERKDTSFEKNDETESKAFNDGTDEEEVNELMILSYPASSKPITVLALV